MSGHQVYRPGEGVEIEALPAEAGFSKINALPGFDPAPGITMNMLSGARAMLNWVRIEPGGNVPEHSHPHEQLGYVIEGSIILRIGDETREIGPETCYVIPGGVPHEGTGGPEGCLVMDVFSPPREDYIAAATGA
jgi:quercetin dioxygenase-like cupin family protein